ncbi:hypothetical protein EVAR_57384_1 [Eumeta japonica]|uniref:Uncharacterized protein n=1 Tax=Eumeta variegata TaxID=151549 RepID=A0A4C1ZGJ0_EUMVA|nr:hypothetical protein EVAR_57384_1 [Eumeta japonica]
MVSVSAIVSFQRVLIPITARAHEVDAAGAVLPRIGSSCVRISRYDIVSCTLPFYPSLFLLYCLQVRDVKLDSTLYCPIAAIGLQSQTPTNIMLWLWACLHQTS